MLKQYLIVAVRNLLKNKVNAAVNISGLATGLCCCMLAMLFVRDELTFDRFHSKADRIYRPWVDEKYNGDTYLSTNTPYVLGQDLHRHVPEVEAATRIFPGNYLMRTGAGQAPISETVWFTTPEFFDIFDFKLVEGLKNDLLPDRRSVVITEEVAEKYFGRTPALGRQLQIKLDSAYTDVTVKGIVQDPPANSSVQFGVLLSADYETVMAPEKNRLSYSNVTPETYVLLREKASREAMEQNAQAMLPTVLGPNYGGDSYFIGFQPLTDIHLNSELPVAFAPVSNRKYSYILAGVALLVLIIACINFMTLSIGQSVARAREIGVRKATGAQRSQLIGQFLGETLLLTAIAVVLGLALARLALPLFNVVTEKQLALHIGAGQLAALLGLTVLVGLLAGAYPALVLSGLRPVAVLKGQFRIGGSGRRVRAGMVVVQFAFSIILISSALIMQRQMSYLQNRSLGFQKEHLLVLPYQFASPPGMLNMVKAGQQRGALLKSELQQRAQANAVSVVMHTFENGWTRVGYLHPETDKQRFFRINVADADYVKTAGMQIMQGRDFDANNVADAKRSLLVNEAMVREYGWSNPVGEKLPGKFRDHEIIGVVKDFNYESLHTAVEPLVIVIDPGIIASGINDLSFSADPTPKLLVRIGGANTLDALDQLQSAWKSIVPDEPFNFSFVDEGLDRQYRRESNLRKITVTASLLAIAVALFGLFALASLNIGARIKEIGIRKVLGASLPGIFILIARDFVKLIAVALVLAVPVTYWFMSDWLKDFAYRIRIDWWVFGLAGLLTVLLTVLTISYQTIKAALVNPVKSLRSE